MPSFIGHTVVGVSAGLGLKLQIHSLPLIKIALLSAVAANLPDVDVVFHILKLDNTEFFMHREGFFHSVFFAAIGGYLLSQLFFRGQSSKFRNGMFLYFSMVIVSHSLLDALTKGVGVAFLYPLSSASFSMPITPLLPAGFNFSEFSQNGAVLRELFIIWLPCISICVILVARLKRKSSKNILG
jgi:membrane-bound metal-dependent hydrolase YbcI (DUF457 family)